MPVKVPLTIRDHLERAALVYGERVAAVDEPDQPAPSLGRITYGRLYELAAAAGGPLRPDGHRSGRAGGDRVPERGAPAGRLLRGQRLGTDLRAHQLPPVRRRDLLHRGSLRGHGPAHRSRAGGDARPHRVRPQDRARPRRRRALPRGRRPRAVGAGRGRHRHHQLHVRHHRPAQGRADDAPQPVGQRRHLRVARRGQRPRRVPPHPADVPLQRVGDALCGHRHGRAPGRAAQGRRCRDPAPGGGRGRNPVVRRARRRVHDPRRRGHLGRAHSRCRPHPHGGGRSAAPHPHHRAGGARAGLGVHPDLRPHRDRPPPHHQPRPRGVGRAARRPSAPPA